MHKPLISVIVPIYNAREYLPKTLRSIRHSKYENLEVILVDDGSTDGSVSICNTYARTDKRFKVIKKENGGVSSARNAGLDAATGEWVAFCDADDTVEPYMFTYLIKKALKYSADIVQCGIYLENDDSSEAVFCPGCDVVFRAASKVFGKHFLKLFSYSCFSKLYRRSILASVRFDESCKVGEDLRFGLDALDNSYKVVFAGKPMYRYLQREDSVIHTTAESGNLTEFDKMIKKASDYYEGHPSLGKVTRRITLLNYTDMCSKIVLGNLPDTESIFDSIRKNIRKNAFFILFPSRFSAKEKAKLLLIGYAPKLYKKLLLKYKPEEMVELSYEAAPAETVSHAAETATTEPETAAESAPEAAPKKARISPAKSLLAKLKPEKTAEETPIRTNDEKPAETEEKPESQNKISAFFKKTLAALKPERLDENAPEKSEDTSKATSKVSAFFSGLVDRLKIKKLETSKTPEAATDIAPEATAESVTEAGVEALGEEELRNIQKSSMEALLEIRRICEKHGLKYYLTAGTLLGAVRGGGFIPWDDDVDVVMPREDYDKFLSLAENEVLSGFFLQNEDTEEDFPFYYSKLRVNGTEVREPAFDGVDIHKGCYADIFPLDVCPSEDGRAERFFKSVLFIQSVLLSKVNPSYECKYEKPLARLAFATAKILPTYLLVTVRDKVRIHYSKTKQVTRLCTVAGSWGYPKETYEAEWFSGEEHIEFEGETFPIPSGYRELLTNMYGDYMTEPSDDNKRSHFLKVNSLN